MVANFTYFNLFPDILTTDISMGQKKVFFVVINCREILRFVFNSFVFFPYSLVILFLLAEAVKGIKDERKKTSIPLDSNFILRFTTILWWNIFLNQ